VSEAILSETMMFGAIVPEASMNKAITSSRSLEITMGLKRRRFVHLGSMVGGGGLALLANRMLTGCALGSGGTASVTPVASPAATSAAMAGAEMASAGTTSAGAPKSAIAPKGLFAPLRGDVRMVVISDLNSAYGSTDYEPEVDRAISLIPDWQPDIVLAGGDMVAGQSPSLTTAQVQAMWLAFDQHIGEPLRKARIPFGFTIGNHDASAALGVSGKFLFSNERELAAAHWRNPKHDPGLTFVDRAQFPFYYTFQHKDIFYLVWDASTSKLSQTQIAWAEKSLASPAAQQAKLRIAIGHLPLYAVAVGRDDLGEILADADRLQALLEKYRVHTYISGHHHAYYPAHRGQLQLLHAGILGAGPRPLLNANLAPFKALTVIDVDLSTASTVYTTYNAQTYALVEQTTLPRLIVGPSGRVLRRDVAETSLTAAERSLTYVADR
jgi:3',5'-cyclic AMP phosphodiesterase CpdA